LREKEKADEHFNSGYSTGKINRGRGGEKANAGVSAAKEKGEKKEAITFTSRTWKKRGLIRSNKSTDTGSWKNWSQWGPTTQTRQKGERQGTGSGPG